MSDQDALDIARSVLGDEQAQQTLDSITEFNAGWQEHLSRTAASIWSRDGLDGRTRSFITIALLTALGRENELAVHVRVARRNGLTPTEIAEALIHTSLYSGVPFVRTGMEIAERVIDEEQAAPVHES